jgi:gluconokinase
MFRHKAPLCVNNRSHIHRYYSLDLTLGLPCNNENLAAIDRSADWRRFRLSLEPAVPWEWTFSVFERFRKANVTKMGDSIVILVMGVSGSGKTTVGSFLANRLNFQFTDGDDFHSEANRAKMHAGQALTDEDRMPWLAVIAANIQTWLKQQKNMVLACSALKESYRRILLDDSEKRIPILFLDGSFECLHERMLKRNHPFMNTSLLQSQFDTLEKPVNAIYLDASQDIATVIETAVKSLSPWLAAVQPSSVND